MYFDADVVHFKCVLASLFNATDLSVGGNPTGPPPPSHQPGVLCKVCGKVRGKVWCVVSGWEGKVCSKCIKWIEGHSPPSHLSDVLRGKVCDKNLYVVSGWEGKVCGKVWCVVSGWEGIRVILHHFLMFQICVVCAHPCVCLLLSLSLSLSLTLSLSLSLSMCLNMSASGSVSMSVSGFV